MYLFDVSLRWMEELILRLKQASLKISCLYPYHQHRKEHTSSSSIVDSLLKHSERIQDLRLQFLPKFLPAKLSLCAPRLENLFIQLSQQPKRPLVIADGDTPILRGLGLIRCPLSLDSLNLSKLRALVLLRAPVQMNTADFLAVLNVMQDLVFLHLVYVLPSASVFLSDGRLDDFLKINLPRLTLLTVIETLSAVVALLSCVNIPLKARLRLEPLFERDSSIDDYTPISSFLTQRFSIPDRPSCPIFLSLLIDAGDAARLKFSSLEHGYYVLNPVKENSHLRLNIHLDIAFGSKDKGEERGETTKSDKHRIMSNICCSLPLTDIQTLHVTKPEFPSAIWNEILGHLGRLRYMKLSDGWMPDLSMLRTQLWAAYSYPH